MKSPDQILADAHAWVRKQNDGKIDPIAVAAYIEGYTTAWDETSASQEPLSITEESFDVFWEIYDKKVGKCKCEKLWAKLSAHDKEACLRYIPAYKQAQPFKQYRKNPETFLRNRSWEDELILRDDGKPTPYDLAYKAARILQG